MGKAVIKSNQGEGRYIVDIEMDTRRVDARKQVLNEANQKLIDEQIPVATQKTDDEFQSLNEKWIALNDYLQSLTSDPDFDTISKLTTSALEQKIEYDLALRNENILRARLLANQKELELLNREVKKLIPRPAWCIEYNEDLTGAVGTVEADYLIKMRGIDGEPEKEPILLPTPHGAEDGMLQTIHSSGPASTFFNLAVYPGAQKHKPRFRLGTITALDQNNDTASVTLDVSTRDPDENSLVYVQDFKPVSFNNVLSHIPVQYMTCNAKAFEVGDRVVVGFGGVWGNGKVIGFEANPRQCGNFIWTEYLDPRSTQKMGMSAGAIADWSATFSYVGNYDRDIHGQPISNTGTHVYTNTLIHTNRNLVRSRTINGVRYERVVTRTYNFTRQETIVWESGYSSRSGQGLGELTDTVSISATKDGLFIGVVYELTLSQTVTQEITNSDHPTGASGRVTTTSISSFVSSSKEFQINDLTAEIKSTKLHSAIGSMTEVRRTDSYAGESNVLVSSTKTTSYARETVGDLTGLEDDEKEPIIEITETFLVTALGPAGQTPTSCNDEYEGLFLVASECVGSGEVQIFP